MSLAGARGLAHAAMTLCESRAAMVLDRVREPDFYLAETGVPFPGEYGMRESQRRRGDKFEQNLYRNDAALLRQVLGRLVNRDPSSLLVRNLDDEVGGSSAPRLRRTRQIFRDLAAGKPVPDIVIHPELALPVTTRLTERLVPDYLLLIPSLGMYQNGEIKSFIVRRDGADPNDLKLTRLQAGASNLALENEANRVGLGSRHRRVGSFVFATSYGLLPAPAFEERLDKYVYQIDRGLGILQQTEDRLARLRALDTPPYRTPLQYLLADLTVRFTDACSTCLRVDICKTAYQDKAGCLGDGAAAAVGQEADLIQVLALADGTVTATTAAEVALEDQLADAARVLGLRRTA